MERNTTQEANDMNPIDGRTRGEIIAQNKAELRQRLIAVANAQNAAYPQYRGTFDNYELAQVRGGKIRTKLGLAAESMEVVIVAPGSRTETYYINARGDQAVGEFVTFYSVRNRVNTIVKASRIRRLA